MSRPESATNGEGSPARPTDGPSGKWPTLSPDEVAAIEARAARRSVAARPRREPAPSKRQTAPRIGPSSLLDHCSLVLPGRGPGLASWLATPALRVAPIGLGDGLATGPSPPILATGVAAPGPV